MAARRTFVGGWVLAAAVFAVGCSTLAGLDDLAPLDDRDASVGGPSQVTTAGGEPDAPPPVPGFDGGASEPRSDRRYERSGVAPIDASADVIGVIRPDAGPDADDEFCAFTGTCTCDGDQDCKRPGFACCNHRCTDLNTDPDHCGSCTNGCTGGRICDQATCTCGGLDPNCAAECVDYFSNPDHCGSCTHSCQGGLCIGGACQPVALASQQAGPAALAVDARNVYFTNQKGNSIGKVPKSGPECQGNGCLLYTTPDVKEPFGIATNGNTLYVANHADGGAGAILSVDSTLAASNAATVLATAKGPWAVATAGGRVYWSALNDPAVVGWVPITGGGATTLVQAASPVDARALATDGVSVLWGTRDSVQGMSQGIFHLSAGATCTGTACYAIANASGAGTPQAFTLSNGWLYWTSTDGCVRRMVKTGGCAGMTPCPVMVAKAQPDPQFIVADGKYVYWTNSGDGSIRHTRLFGNTCTGATCQALAGGLGEASGLADDGQTLFITSKSSGRAGAPGNTGMVWKLAKPE